MNPGPWIVKILGIGTGFLANIHGYFHLLVDKCFKVG
jgi:hypothetical protein